MSNEDQYALPPSAPESAQQIPPGLSPQGAARRRFARAGMGASGVILTLASAPGMATTVCRPPSGFLSGTWGSSHPNAPSCFGATPADWSATTQDRWIAYGRTDPTRKFNFVFDCTANTSALKNFTLLEIVSGNSGTADQNEVAKYIIAALLNARAGTTPVLDEAKVFQIWNEFNLKLSYTPNAGALPWGGVDIVKYLKSTMVGYTGS